MDFLPETISRYAELYSEPEDEILAELSRETYLKVPLPQMLSGHLQGKVLTFISRMIQPSRILEIGTFTGYSAICLAKGLRENGVLHTIDNNEELQPIIEKYIGLAGLKDKIRLHIADATLLIPQMQETYDLVFIDADKRNYCCYFDLVIEKVRSGGLIIADNVLWSGKVTQEKHDQDTAAIHAYNQKVLSDERVENFILPIRDGLNIARRL
jgi:predicted O-methyltransferase YrrM